MTMIKSTHGQGGEARGLDEKDLNTMEREVLTHLRRAGKEKHTKDVTEAILGKATTPELLKVRNALRRLVREDYVWRLEKSMYIAAEKTANGHKRVAAPGMAETGGSLVKRVGAKKGEASQKKSKPAKPVKAGRTGLGIPRKAKAAQEAEEVKAEAEAVAVEATETLLAIPGTIDLPVPLHTEILDAVKERRLKLSKVKVVAPEAIITRDEKATMASINADCVTLFGSSFLDGKVVVAAFHTSGSNARISRLTGCAVGYAQRRIDKMGRDRVKATTTLTKVQAQEWLAAAKGSDV